MLFKDGKISNVRRKPAPSALSAEDRAALENSLIAKIAALNQKMLSSVLENLRSTTISASAPGESAVELTEDTMKNLAAAMTRVKSVESTNIGSLGTEKEVEPDKQKSDSTIDLLKNL